MTESTYPEPGTPIQIAATLGNSSPLHLVLGHMVEHSGDEVVIRPRGSYSTVSFDPETVESINEVPFSALENKITVERLDHPLPETIREHLVRHHGYTIPGVDGSSVESLFDAHDHFHREGQHLSHVHGLTARERDLVDKINRKDL